MNAQFFYFFFYTNSHVENINTNQILVMSCLCRETNHASVEQKWTTLKNMRLLGIIVFTLRLLSSGCCGCTGVQISSLWVPLISSHALLWDKYSNAQCTQNGGRQMKPGTKSSHRGFSSSTNFHPTIMLLGAERMIILYLLALCQYLHLICFLFVVFCFHPGSRAASHKTK